MSVPFLALHGEMDKLCCPSGSSILFDRASVADKTLKIFPDARHNLYLEVLPIREEALTDTVEWIFQRIPSWKHSTVTSFFFFNLTSFKLLTGSIKRFFKMVGSYYFVSST